MLLLTAKAGVLEPATTHARQDAVPPALGHVTDVEEPVQEPALGAKVAAMAAMAIIPQAVNRVVVFSFTCQLLVMIAFNLQIYVFFSILQDAPVLRRVNFGGGGKYV